MGLILKGHVPAPVPVPVPVEIGGEASLGNRKISTGAYKTKVCTECLNEHVVDNYLTYDPMRAYPKVDDVSESTRVAIIPYMLYLDLKDCGYSEEGIQSIPSTTYADLLRIKEERGKKGGITPCEDGRIGYKLKIRLNNCQDVHCWIIVGDMEGKYAYRFSYGGKKGVC